MADDGQMIPEDPDYVAHPPTIQRFEEPPVEKRQKVSEANTEPHVNAFDQRLTCAL